MLLGLELPVLDEERARTYLSHPSVGVLSGATGLVRLGLRVDLVTALGAGPTQAVGTRAVQDGSTPAPGTPEQMVPALRGIWPQLL